MFPADAPAVLRAFVSAIDVADARHQPEAIVTLAERALARPLERIAHEAPDEAPAASKATIGGWSNGWPRWCPRGPARQG